MLLVIQLVLILMPIVFRWRYDVLSQYLFSSMIFVRGSG